MIVALFASLIGGVFPKGPAAERERSVAIVPPRSFT